MKSNKKTYHNSTFSMGTRFEIVLPNIEGPVGDDIFSDISSELKRLENIFNRFSNDSLISKINATAFEKPVVLDDELWDIFVLCKKYYFLTHHAFDITIAPLMKLWNIKHGYKLDFFEPSAFEIDEAMDLIGMDKVELDENTKSVSLKVQGMEIDFGGFGKGYAIDIIKEILKNRNVNDAFISFGESSVLGMGHHPEGDMWKTGITHLLQKDKIVHTFGLRDKTLSNSGSTASQSGFNKYGHIIDPDTGYPIKGNISVSVICDSAVIGEILSTGLLIRFENGKDQIFPNFPECNAVLFEYVNNNDVQITELK